jgi:hypothetical protein
LLLLVKSWKCPTLRSGFQGAVFGLDFDLTDEYLVSAPFLRAFLASSQTDSYNRRSVVSDDLGLPVMISDQGLGLFTVCAISSKTACSEVFLPCGQKGAFKDCLDLKAVSPFLVQCRRILASW